VDYLTHYYRKEIASVSSLSLLTDEEAARLMETMYVEDSVIWERFRDPCQQAWQGDSPL
jgi:hypothetical protein